MERETLHRRVTNLYALADEVLALRSQVAELTAASIDEAAEMAEAEVELEAMRREHSAPCRVPDSPDCTCPSPERLLARDELKRMLRGHLFGGGTP
ncbi:hypothetical protein ACIBQ3_33065 [Streptomyces rubiginosohelvolus]|uniref:hypothetical protein n=1 Tax=Streptomyces rubiginosohelvolus TaxID=67362 RepID=UPI003798906D